MLLQSYLDVKSYNYTQFIALLNFIPNACLKKGCFDQKLREITSII